MKTRILYFLLVAFHWLRTLCTRLMQILAPRYIFGLPNCPGNKAKQQRVADFLASNEITETLTRRLDEAGINIHASFKAELVRRTIKKRYLDLPEWCLNDKSVGSSFALGQGLNVPRTLQSNTTVGELQLIPGTVIKPISGSGGEGVYLYLHDASIINMKTLRRLDSIDDLKTGLKSHSAGAKARHWRVEELICGPSGWPAHDLKFYCFYGVVGLVLEVRRVPNLAFCWWGGDGKVTSVGKYERQAFQGLGPTPESRAVAIRISSDIPAPFVRIDFLAGADKLYFGEFTPRPGKFHEFNCETDRRLGNCFLDAEARLERDLMSGKRFSAFQSCHGART